MQIKNTIDSYGIIAIIFHWVVAVAVIGMYLLGLWMDDLEYYDPWYTTAPHIHKSIGVIVISLVVARLIWRWINPVPKSLRSHKKWEQVLAKLTHGMFYILLISMFFSGYLITTAEGKSLQVFNWFGIPAMVTEIENLEDVAGEIHEVIANTIILLATLHALAAIKHQFFDKDGTLLRMFGKSQVKS